MWRLAAAACIALVLPAPAPAQVIGRCLPHADAVANLARQHGEQQVGIGVAQSGAMLYELFVAEDGATWTVLATRPNGISCLAAEGTGWTTIPYGSGEAL